MQAYLKDKLVRELRKLGWVVAVTEGQRTLRQDMEVQLPRKVYITSVKLVNRRTGETKEFDIVKKGIPSPDDARKLFRTQ